MGLMSKILGGSGGTRQTEDYVELSADDLAGEDVEADTEVKIAKIADKSDVIDIKDEVYDGNIVIADITRHSTQDRTMEHITDELKQVAKEVRGDIVQKDDDQLIITPTGARISRERIGH
ncbi:cell division protein SepF [Halovenus sp. HT40]|uniref:cell division protein SepF n=1 Tax=Halovenus sp. HT40 TaxID=3126691 RepID=UPI00300ECF95